MRTQDAAARTLPDADDPTARLTGIGLMCGALIAFTFLDTTVKWLGHSLNTVEITWARYTGNFLLVVLAIRPWANGQWRTRRPVAHILRGLVLIGCTAGNFIALQYLQLDQTMSIVFSTPFFVALLAGPLLGEWIGPRRWIAIMVGFAGILVIVRPTASGVHPAVFASLGSAVCYALYNIATRRMAATESTGTLMLYASGFGALMTSLPLPWFWTVPSEPGVIVNLAMTGVYGAIGHLLLTLAHRRAPAAVLAPFLYSQIIWMILAGWLMFGQVPNGWTLLGVAIVIASGLYLIARERTQRAIKAIEATVAE